MLTRDRTNRRTVTTAATTATPSVSATKVKSALSVFHGDLRWAANHEVTWSSQWPMRPWATTWVTTKPDPISKLIAWGPSPRASQALMLAVRARALLDGRYAPSVDDVVALAEPVLKHRMALTFASRADGESVAGVVGRLKARIG